MPPVPQTPKPRDRSHAENRATNLARYDIGGFGDNATKTLGIKVKYPQIPQGVSILDFDTDSKARDAGIEIGDLILEVDGSAVGIIRGRHYEPWERYGRSGTDKVEVLVALLQPNGEFRYYYPEVSFTAIEDVLYSQAPAGMAGGKPTLRNSPENAQANFGRYKIDENAFNLFSRFSLGVNIDYVGSFGQKNALVAVAPNQAAEKAGLKVGDILLEVDGSPIGQIGNRIYEAWRQYIYSKAGLVELLVAFFDPAINDFRFYYPMVQLDDLSSPN